ncbi:MAG TPA: phosphoglucosamine mutase [Solirubrobacterales bacterium]|nr:phosphoglucosamine mutase [Solirubrobacterales bacterium]
MTKKLFGTDGVRGVAGDEITAELALALGRAAAAEVPADRPQVLLVRDTRESGQMLESALAGGIAQAGGDAWLAGVLPTPAASVLVRRHGLDLAVVISASHNPWRDNGIKFFGPDGGKLDGALEERIEARVVESASDGGPPGEAGRVRALEGALDDYLRELSSYFQLDLKGRKVVLDCAHGATYRAAPAIFERLGAAVDVIGGDPDGRNINEGFGSTHPEALSERVVSTGASLGFAFDGDGDRVIAVDAEGEVRDGDELIALIARHLQEQGELEGGVVVTVMSNYGFHQAMDEAAIGVATTPVGDRYVADALSERDWRLGGEQSGHLIWTEFAPTGDGIAAALLVTRSLGDRDLAGAVPMRKLPQVLRNVEVADRAAAERSTALAEAVERENAALEGRGRVLVRPSGTEPLVRVMVEAPDVEECEAVCERLVGVVQNELGA